MDMGAVFFRIMEWIFSLKRESGEIAIYIFS